ncbi:hypothetical protein HID58_018865 [Brassica napus]|uniref:Uncharacterized protein n=1 Tax=Brassica napus TaxID=3708 RepID=A0ABQ8DB52_BRANA|nr:hypothetical protein HID58_018865 [Brassica napus]
MFEVKDSEESGSKAEPAQVFPPRWFSAIKKRHVKLLQVDQRLKFLKRHVKILHIERSKPRNRHG